MADQKITALTNDTSPTTDDLLVTVNDPLGTPANRNVKLSDLITLLLPAGSLWQTAQRAAPTGFLLCDGSAVSRTTYAGLFAAIVKNKGAFTVTIATPGVVSFTAHGLLTGDAVYLTTTGALPTGLTANTLYYVIKVDANSFNLATTRANAHSSTKINTTGSQSGVHTLMDCPFGLGDGSTTFNVPDARGRILAGADGMGGSLASRLTLAQSQGSYGELGASGGEEGHAMTSGENGAHTHGPGGTASNFMDYVGSGGTVANAVGSNFSLDTTTASSGSGTAHNNVQPTLAVSHMIKT